MICYKLKLLQHEMLQTKMLQTKMLQNEMLQIVTILALPSWNYSNYLNEGVKR